MANKKQTRRALFMSVISLVLCMAMLVGTTFAWFTDTVESGRNVITAGNLDIKLSTDAGEVNGESVLFKNIDGDKWEPGVVAYENFTVENVGNLALKYNMNLTVLEETTTEVEGVIYKLGDAIKVGIVEGSVSGDRDAVVAAVQNWTTLSDFVLDKNNVKMEAGAEAHEFAVVLYWQPDVDYNDGNFDNIFNLNNLRSEEEALKLEIGVNLYATQVEAESDSFGDDYDANAKYSDSDTITVNADGSITLVAGGVTVEAPAGAFNKGDEVKIKVKTAKTLADVSSAGAAVASIDVVMIVNGVETSADLEDSYYTVTYNISKGLDSVDVDYTGTDGKAEPENVEYDAESGELTFQTNHFSEYVITGKAYGYNVENDTAYATAADAAQAALTGDAVIPVEDLSTVCATLSSSADRNEFKKKNGIAVYGNNYYLTVSEVADAFNTARTLKILRDFNLSQTLTLNAGNTLTLDLNGHTISGMLSGTGNQDLVLVKGNLTVTNGTMEMTVTQNQGWNAMSAIFDVTAGGVLNVEDANIINLGGTDMAFCVHLNNWGEVTLNADNVNFESSYIAVRVFNSGNDMNNVTIKKSTLTAKYCYWVHNYTLADFGSQEKADAQKALLNENILNNGNIFNNSGKAPLLYGFNDSIYMDANGNVVVDDQKALIVALENGQSVLLYNDIKIEPASLSNAYGATGLNVKNGQTIDGNGHTLDIKGAGGTWDSGINTTGGLIQNITVTGSFRGIFINHNSTYSEPVVLKNVIIDGTTYTVSCDQGMNQNLEAYNSTFNGWTSYAATIGTVKFDGCSFGEGGGYAFCRPYAPTAFIGCDFEAGFEMDPRAAVTFENCTIGGVALTAENLSTLVTSNIANATVK